MMDGREQAGPGHPHGGTGNVLGDEAHAQRASYPAPAIVLGLGRLGLSVLERLAEEWQWLASATGATATHGRARAPADPSIRNLRLIHAAPDPTRPVDWRVGEKSIRTLAQYVGDDELTRHALNFAIVRALGLIRYREGFYQVAVPRDAGIVDKKSASEATSGPRLADISPPRDDSKSGEDDFGSTRRLRYFHWHSLAADPLAASVGLQQACQRHGDVDNFLSPIVDRVRHGDSPRILLHLLGRLKAHATGRDPSPWGWLKRWIYPAAKGSPPATPPLHDGRLRVAYRSQWLTEEDRAGLLELRAEPPIPGWNPRRSGIGHEISPSCPEVQIPELFVPAASDLDSPLDPLDLLRLNWEASGWAAGGESASDSVEFTPVEASLFRLGFVDHDGTSRIHEPGAEVSLAERQRSFATMVHRGLVALWMDLQRVRVEDFDLPVGERMREDAEANQRQSLTVLSELVVAPLLDNPDQAVAPTPPSSGVEALSPVPSAFLRTLKCRTEADRESPQHVVSARLAELGVPIGDRPSSVVSIFSGITLPPPADEAGKSSQLDALRMAVTDAARDLYDFQYLLKYRGRAARQAPRLTVFVVGDVREPFVRSTLQPVLGTLHDALRRSLTPLFRSSRVGFERPICVEPILWMPHAADAARGRSTESPVLEEAAIIEAVQNVRRWAESVPLGQRSVGQIFVNSTLTDFAVMTEQDAARQTGDFISFQIRNDFSGDEYIRTALAGQGVDDIFATFTCHQIDFPAERARDYLANRLAREGLGLLRSDPDDGTSSGTRPPEEVQTKPLEVYAEPSYLKQVADLAAGLNAVASPRTHSIDVTKRAQELARAFGRGFEATLYEKVVTGWESLVLDDGGFDQDVVSLRQAASRELKRANEATRRYADTLITDNAGRGAGGLHEAISGIRATQRDRLSNLREAERTRIGQEQQCVQETIPDSAVLAARRADVVEAVRKKPDLGPMRVAVLLTLVMGFALGAPIPYLVARSAELHIEPDWKDAIVGYGGWLIGALVVLLPVWLLMRRHLRKRTNHVIEAGNGLQTAAVRLVSPTAALNLAELIEKPGDKGPQQAPSAMASNGPARSIQSFLGARHRMTRTLAERGLALRAFQQTDRDKALADRILRSLDIQLERLRAGAEALSVHFRNTAGSPSPKAEVDHDVSSLFLTRHGGLVDRLAAPEQLLNRYRREVGRMADLEPRLPDIIKAADGFARWRTEASLWDTERILDFGRAAFDDMVSSPVAAQAFLVEEVSRNLASFADRHHANVTFGARFSGLEGFDTNGHRIVADSTLVLNRALQSLFDDFRREDNGASFKRANAMTPLSADILPNSAFMLSLVQGLRSDSIRNLQRFELATPRRIEDLDPIAGRYHGVKVEPAVTPLTGQQAVRDGVYDHIVAAYGRTPAPRPAPAPAPITAPSEQPAPVSGAGADSTLDGPPGPAHPSGGAGTGSAQPEVASGGPGPSGDTSEAGSRELTTEAAAAVVDPSNTDATPTTPNAHLPDHAGTPAYDHSEAGSATAGDITHENTGDDNPDPGGVPTGPSSGSAPGSSGSASSDDGADVRAGTVSGTDELAGGDLEGPEAALESTTTADDPSGNRGPSDTGGPARTTGRRKGKGGRS
jgi:hypothetical protein